MSKREIISQALVRHWNNDDVTLEDTCGEIYDKVVDKAIAFINDKERVYSSVEDVIIQFEKYMKG